MSLRFDHLSGVGQVKLTGHFSGQSALDFLPAIRRTLPAYANHPLVINMEDVERIDTLGMGAMLVLHRDAERQATVVHIKNCKQHVRDVFRIANLDKPLCFD